MSGINEISAIDMLSVHGQSHSGENFDRSLNDNCDGEALAGLGQLRVTFVFGVGDGQHRHEHGHRAVPVQQAEQ